MSTEMHQTIANYITQKILNQPNRVLRMDQPLFSAGILDSLTIIDLALFVESTFGVKLKNSELNDSVFDTVNELVSLITRKQQNVKPR